MRTSDSKRNPHDGKPTTRRSSLTRKIFFGLVAIALVPLLAVTFAGRTALYSAAQNLGERGEKLLRSMVVDNVVSTVNKQAWSVDLVGDTMHLGADYLNHQVESMLRGPIPKGAFKDLGIYLEQDFRNKATAPPDATPEPDYLRKGRMHSGLTSYSEPSFFLPPSGDQEQMEKDAARMASIDKWLLNLKRLMGDHVFRMFITLDSGVHIAYPGLAGSPRHYDPRQSGEYRTLANGGQSQWVGPMIDPATRKVIFSLITPLHNADGTFAGITGISILVTDMYNEQEVFSQWTTSARMYIVGLYPGAEGKDEMFILAQREYAEKNGRHMGWREPISIAHLTSDDRAGQYEFMSQINRKDEGYAFLPHQGVDSLWAFANINKSSAETIAAVLIVPASVTEALPTYVRSMVEAELVKQATISGSIALLVVGVLFFVAIVVSHRSTTTLHAMADMAKQLANGNFSARIALRTNDERDIVIETLNEIGPKLEESVHAKGALAVAQEVQQSLLPTDAPDIPGFDIAGASQYSDETGGDYYDYFHLDPLPDGPANAIVVGDVSGHGVGAALLMASARASLRAARPRHETPAQCIEAVNTLLAQDLTGSGRFMTLFYLEICQGGHLRWVRAGHDPALRFSPTKDEFSELGGDGLVLGVVDAFEYEEQSLQQLEQDEIIVIGTDGIWEAPNEADEMFGKDRLKEIIRKTSSRNAQEILTAILEAVDAHTGPSGANDDVTLVVVKKKGYSTTQEND